MNFGATGEMSGVLAASREGSEVQGELRSGVDYDIHGLVSIRLVDASPGDVAQFERQLSLSQTKLEGRPDITVKFVKEITPKSTIRYAGHHDGGYSDDAFYLLDRNDQPKACFPFEDLGASCTIICRSGSGTIPFLISSINFRALARGVVPLHAGAFEYRGETVLVTGWSKGGKTETLLAFMNRGAKFIGDEWVYVHPDGKLQGLPEPIRLWDWHLEDLPEYEKRLSRSMRVKLAGYKAASSLARVVGSSDFGERLSTRLNNQRNVRLSPFTLFGDSNCTPNGKLTKVLFVYSHSDDRVVTETSSYDEIARRMVLSLEYEGLDIYSTYLKYRFCFPNSTNSYLERSFETQAEALSKVFSDIPTFTVGHPYPVAIDELFHSIEPLLR